MEQLTNGSNQVRLRLHPPELGSLQVTIRIEGQQVAGLIEVEHTGARDALQNNLPQLQARLSDQGLNVQQFEIRVVDPNQFSQGGQLGGTWHNGHQQKPDEREERRANSYLDRLRNRIDSKETEPSRPHPRLWTRTQGHIDVRV
jgi:flagellar hook-length control protein FliK